MPPKLTVKKVGDGFEVEVPAEDELSKVEPERIEHFINSRLACAARNRCGDKNRTIAERLDCISSLADRRIAQVGQAELAGKAKVTVSKGAKGIQISIAGSQPDRLKKALESRQLEAALNDIRACRQANRCGARNQTLAQRWQCVATLGARRFADL